MKLLVINPNTTQAMTASIAETADRGARPGTEIEAVSPPWGPASIEDHAEEAGERDPETQRHDSLEGVRVR